MFGAMGMLLVISLLHMHKAHTKLAVEHGQFQMLYNKWGTHDDNDHWGGVGRCVLLCAGVRGRECECVCKRECVCMHVCV